MPKLSFEKAVSQHRKMWTWIAKEEKKMNLAFDAAVHNGISVSEMKPEWIYDKADTRYRLKVQWLKDNTSEPVLYDCFCCEYSDQQEREHPGSRRCGFCPLKWRKDDADGSLCVLPVPCENAYGVSVPCENAYGGAYFNWKYDSAEMIANLPLNTPDKKTAS